MIVGVLKIELYMEGNRSLKEKRSSIKGIIGKIKSKFVNISISEIDSLDLWKKATLGIAFVGNETHFVNSVLDKILDFIEDTGLYQILFSDIELINI